MEGNLMKEGWKSVLMRHGEQFVTTFLHGDGILQKQILFVNSLATLVLVRKFIIN